MLSGADILSERLWHSPRKQKTTAYVDQAIPEFRADSRAMLLELTLTSLNVQVALFPVYQSCFI